MRIMFILLLAMLHGCSTTGGAITVSKAVPITCQEQEPEVPAMPTDDLKLGADVEMYVRAARAERLVRIGYESRLLTALRACTQPLGE